MVFLDLFSQFFNMLLWPDPKTSLSVSMVREHQLFRDGFEPFMDSMKSKLEATSRRSASGLSAMERNCGPRIISASHSNRRFCWDCFLQPASPRHGRRYRPYSLTIRSHISTTSTLTPFSTCQSDCLNPRSRNASLLSPLAMRSCSNWPARSFVIQVIAPNFTGSRPLVQTDRSSNRLSEIEYTNLWKLVLKGRLKHGQ